MLALIPALAGLGTTISVPLDYFDRAAGRGHIYYELGAPFDRKKPTLFVIADGQQFFIRKGRMPIVQKGFGPAFNVVGIVGRAEAPDIAAAAKVGGKPDWLKAWRYYRSENWVEDIETVRRRVVGQNGKILIYGASGGAMLAQQYLARYGRHVLRAETKSTVMPWIENELALRVRSFWEGISPESRKELGQVLKEHVQDRQTLTIMFQRQHFFVSADKLQDARAALIHALAIHDDAAYKKAQDDYQVGPILQFLSSDVAIPIRVREFEFLAAGNRIYKPSQNRYDAGYESSYDDAEPLIELRKAGKIGVPSFDFAALHKLSTDVLVVIGSHDEAGDYRSSISLAARYPHGTLLILNDNHVFSGLSKSGLSSALDREFLLHGSGSKQFGAVRAKLEPMIWHGD